MVLRSYWKVYLTQTTCMLNIVDFRVCAVDVHYSPTRQFTREMVEL